MLKQSTYLLAFVLAANIGNAQLLRSISPRIAYSSSYHEFKYTNPVSVDWKRRNGIGVAVAFEWLDLPTFSLITQLEYAQRGVGATFIITSQSSPEGIGFADKVARVDYLSLPILVKVNPFGGIISPYALVGARFDFVLAKRSDDNFLATVYDKFSKITYGVSLGAGASFSALLDLPIIFEVRYDLDLKDSYQTEFLTVRNNAITVWLGVAFSS